MSHKIKIGFIPLYDINFASSRYRVYQFRSWFQEFGFGCYYAPAPMGNNLRRLVYLPRFFLLAMNCDVLYVQKRTFPNWIIKLIKSVNEHILYDFDDALYLQKTSIKQFHETIRSAKLVIAGNQFLAAYAQKINPAVIEIPTVVNTDYYCPLEGNRHPQESRVLIGWIGSDPNRGDLDLIEDSLEELIAVFPNKVALKIIARLPYSTKKQIQQIFTPWTLDTSLLALQEIDIGIMPLENNDWNKGKCAFKLIQYSAVSAANIASPVGMNDQVVLHGITGYLADSQEEWYEQLSMLIKTPELRTKLGEQGRRHIQENYSVKKWFPRLVEAIELVARS